MSDEPEQLEDAPEYPATDESERFAVAMYQSHTAELAQAFGNLLTQALAMPPDHPLMSVSLSMLERVAANVEVTQKGSLRAVRGGKD
jgi:hypothetical protein